MKGSSPGIDPRWGLQEGAGPMFSDPGRIRGQECHQDPKCLGTLQGTMPFSLLFYLRDLKAEDREL